MMEARQLRHVTIRDGGVLRRKPEIEREIRAALDDLRLEHDFAPCDPPGVAPYDLTLALEDHKLVLHLRAGDGEGERRIALGLQPLRPIIRDYFIICENYYAAVHAPNRTQLEAIDAGRRGAHDEGASMLREMLRDKVRLDACTARRLFTLVAALHLGGWSNR